MNIFDATLKLKDCLYENNPQMIKVGNQVERAPFSPLPLLYYFNEIKSLKQYEKKIKVAGTGPFLFDPTISVVATTFKDEKVFLNRYYEVTPTKVNTKEYWNFLHENFPFCDVCAYYRVNDLKSYFEVKGQHYDSIISQLSIDFFRNKKILEIGPGYGYLPKFLKENNVVCNYYCADIVKRFNHDNFIDIDGYTLSNITDKFDIIFMYDVIQHLGSHIFKTYTEELRNLLNDDGVFVTSISSNVRPDHLNYFFGQTYYNLGIDNFETHMTNTGYKVNSVKTLTINKSIIGSIVVFDKLEKLNDKETKV